MTQTSENLKHENNFPTTDAWKQILLQTIPNSLICVGNYTYRKSYNEQNVLHHYVRDKE